MQLIDEQGDLFGAVNVVDALVLLFVLAIVVAGAAVLAPEGEPETRYVTMELGEQPVSIAERISEGDVMERGGHNLTITDVYLGPGRENAVSLTVVAEVKVRGQSEGGAAEFAGEPLVPGASVPVQTEKYEVAGMVTDVSDDRSRLATSESTVTVRTTLDRNVARSIDEGDTYEIAGQEVATITAAGVFPSGQQDERTALLEMRLQTLEERNGHRFGGRPVKIGSTVPFRTGEYDLDAGVVRRGPLLDDEATDSVTAVVELENVSPELVDGVQVGSQERVRDTTYARVTDRRVEPAVVVLTSEDGNIHQREHPRNKDVYLTVELTVHETPEGDRFHGEPLRIGSDVHLEFESTTVNGRIIELGDD